MTDYKEILQMKDSGISERQISEKTGISRNTIAKVTARAQEKEVHWTDIQDLADDEVGKLLFPERFNNEELMKTSHNKRMPDLKYIVEELEKKHVTRTLLWKEYCEECSLAGEDNLEFSQFCLYVKQYQDWQKMSMRIRREPGEGIEVDWAGTPAHITDPGTGKPVDVWLFVGALGYSQYAYAEGFLNERTPNWIKAHVNMYEYFGGVTPLLVPDNSATAVNRSDYDWYTPSLNRAYREMAAYYGTSVQPARIKKPKDKPDVESVVGNVSTWITAALRNEQFFSLEDFNKAARKKLDEYNAGEFDKKKGSRKSLFLTEDKPKLQPLPKRRFEYSEKRKASVHQNYHIVVDHMYYSVPCRYSGKKVDVRLTDSAVEIFCLNDRIASHKRLYGEPCQYSTLPEHLPPDHRRFALWDSKKLRSWGLEVGPDTAKTVDIILGSGQNEKVCQRSCMGLYKLSLKYSKAVLEAACARALFYTKGKTSYEAVKSVIKTFKDAGKYFEAKPEVPRGIVRGADYYS